MTLDEGPGECPEIKPGSEMPQIEVDHATLHREEISEMRDYAWRYFALHADQRIRLFQFYVGLSGAILGLSAAVMSGSASKATLVLPLLLPVLSLIFCAVDERTRQLVRSGEDALKALETKWGCYSTSDVSTHPIMLIHRDGNRGVELGDTRKPTLKREHSYTDCFRATYFALGVGGMVLVFVIAFRG